MRYIGLDSSLNLIVHLHTNSAYAPKEKKSNGDDRNVNESRDMTVNLRARKGGWFGNKLDKMRLSSYDRTGELRVYAIEQII